jgi:soluble lytic murein transglycosylase-like protein
MASPLDSQYDGIRQKIVNKALEYGLNPSIAVWQLWQESKFNPGICSGAGACGIAQFMPGTAEEWGVDVNDVDSSLDGWGEYMDHLASLPYIGNDYRLILAAYNAGEGRVKQYGGVPPIAETQNYVNTIMANATAHPVAGSSLVAGSYSGDNGTNKLLIPLVGIVILYLLLD